MAQTHTPGALRAAQAIIDYLVAHRGDLLNVSPEIRELEISIIIARETGCGELLAVVTKVLDWYKHTIQDPRCYLPFDSKDWYQSAHKALARAKGEK